MQAVNQELERLKKMGVFSKVDYSDWAARMVYEKKKIRVCADFSTGLNDCLKIIHTRYPTEYIFSKLNGGKVFSKIDLKHIKK